MELRYVNLSFVLFFYSIFKAVSQGSFVACRILSKMNSCYGLS